MEILTKHHFILTTIFCKLKKIHVTLLSSNPGSRKTNGLHWRNISQLVQPHPIWLAIAEPPIKSLLIITRYSVQHCFVIHHTRWEQLVTRIRCRVCMYICIGEQQGCQKWLSPCSNYHTMSREVLPSRVFHSFAWFQCDHDCHRDEGIRDARSINFRAEQQEGAIDFRCMYSENRNGVQW